MTTKQRGLDALAVRSAGEDDPACDNGTSENGVTARTNGAARNGARRNGAASRDGRASRDGASRNGAASNGAHANGAASNGAASNGHAAKNGAGTNGAHVREAFPGALTRQRRAAIAAASGPTLRSADDTSLVSAVRAGNENAFEAMYDRYSRSLLSFCRHSLGSQEEAEDALQQTFMKAFRALRSNDSEIILKPWLYTIARNECTSIHRRRRETPETDEPTTIGLEAKVEQREELRGMLRDLAGLPFEQREALLLTSLGTLSGKQIADVLGCRPERVKSLVFRARRSLALSRAARNATCEEIQAQLEELRGGSLRRGLIRRHLLQCESCREFQINVRRQRALIGALLPVLPSPALKDLILGALGEEAVAGATAASFGAASQLAGGAGAAGGSTGGSVGGAALAGVGSSTASSVGGATVAGVGAGSVGGAAVGGSVGGAAAVGGLEAALAGAGAKLAAIAAAGAIGAGAIGGVGLKRSAPESPGPRAEQQAEAGSRAVVGKAIPGSSAVLPGALAADPGASDAQSETPGALADPDTGAPGASGAAPGDTPPAEAESDPAEGGSEPTPPAGSGTGDTSGDSDSTGTGVTGDTPSDDSDSTGTTDTSGDSDPIDTSSGAGSRGGGHGGQDGRGRCALRGNAQAGRGDRVYRSGCGGEEELGIAEGAGDSTADAGDGSAEASDPGTDAG